MGLVPQRGNASPKTQPLRGGNWTGIQTSLLFGLLCPIVPPKEPLQIPGNGSQLHIAESGAESVVPEINGKYSTKKYSIFLLLFNQ